MGQRFATRPVGVFSLTRKRVEVERGLSAVGSDFVFERWVH